MNCKINLSLERAYLKNTVSCFILLKDSPLINYSVAANILCTLLINQHTMIKKTFNRKYYERMRIKCRTTALQTDIETSEYI